MSEMLDKAKALAAEAAAKLSEAPGVTPDDLGQKAQAAVDKLAELADTAVVKVTELADTHGDKVTDAVAKAAAFVDEKSGGKTSDLSERVQSATASAVDAFKGGDDTPQP